MVVKCSNPDFMGSVYRTTMNIFERFEHKIPKATIVAPKDFEPWVKWLYEIQKRPLNYTSFNPKKDPFTFQKNKKVLLAFSGGLDSAYTALSLRDEGYEVYLLHFSNFNPEFASQDDTLSQQFAGRYKFMYKNIIIDFPKDSDYFNNPCLYQLLLSMMADYAAKTHIANIAFSSGNLMYSDSIKSDRITQTSDNFNYFWSGVQGFYPGINLIKLTTNKYDRYEYIVKNYPECLTLVSSCASPLNKRQSLIELNVSKYNIQPWVYRCLASCYKCAVERLMLMDLKYFEMNHEVEAQCFRIINESPLSDFKGKWMLFDKQKKYELLHKNFY